MDRLTPTTSAWRVVRVYADREWVVDRSTQNVVSVPSQGVLTFRNPRLAQAAPHSAEVDIQRLSCFLPSKHRALFLAAMNQFGTARYAIAAT